MNKRKQAIGVQAMLYAMVFAAISTAVFRSTPTASASVATAPTVSVTISSLGSPGFYDVAQISISSPGPFSDDFQIVFCFGSECTTTPWASTTTNGVAGFSTWVWPGYYNGMGPGALTIQSVNTRPLPAGEQLTNVSVGIELYEDPAGNEVGTTNDCHYDPTAFTPLPWYESDYYSTAGQSGPERATDCSGNYSATPDEARIAILAEGVRAATMAATSTIPNTMTTGQTLNNVVITATNTGTYNPYVVNTIGYGPATQAPAGGYPPYNAFTSAGPWHMVATGPPQGQCAYSSGTIVDSNGNPVNDVSNNYDDGNGDNEYSCTVTVTATANDINLTHTGSFITSATVPYSVSNVTIDSWFSGSGPQQEQDCNPNNEDDSDYDCQPTYTPPSSAGTYYSVPLSDQYNPFVEYNNWGVLGFYAPGYLEGSSSGQSVSFTVPTFTAPSTPGTYTETWTLNDGNGAVPGGTYSKTITVVGTGGTASVSSDRATTWQLVGGPSALQQTTPATSATYSNVTPDQYILLDLNNNTPYGFNVTSTATGYVSPPSLLSSIIKTADASSCSSWTCLLSNGGTISYNLNTQYCSIKVNASLNGGNPGLAGVAYTVAGSAPAGNSNSGTTTSGTNTFQLISDPMNAQTFDFSANSLSPTVTASGTTADFNGYTITRTSDGATVTNAYNGGNGGLACSPGDTLTFTANYKTRAVIQVK